MRVRTAIGVGLVLALLVPWTVMAQGLNLTLLGVPSATVAPPGVGYVALSGTPDSEMNGRTDGSLELGFGLGSAENTVGVQGKVVITSLTDSLGDSGYVGVKLSRRVATTPVPLYLGLDFDNLGGWGESSTNDPTVNVMVTGFGTVQAGNATLPVMATLGAGNRLRDDDTQPGVFAGIGAGFTESLGGSVAWTGETVDFGLSLRPAPDVPLVVNLTLNDTTDRLGDRQLSVSAAWIFGMGGGK